MKEWEANPKTEPAWAKALTVVVLVLLDMAIWAVSLIAWLGVRAWPLK